MIAYFFCALTFYDLPIYIYFVLALLAGIIGGWGQYQSIGRLMDNALIYNSNSKYLANILVLFGDIGMVVGTVVAIGINYSIYII